MPEPIPEHGGARGGRRRRTCVLHPMEALVRVAQAPAHAAAVVGQTLDGLRSIVGMGNAAAAVRSTSRWARIGGSRRRRRRSSGCTAIKRALGGTMNDVVLTAVARRAARPAGCAGRADPRPDAPRDGAGVGAIEGRARVTSATGSPRRSSTSRSGMMTPGDPAASACAPPPQALKSSAMAVSADSIIGLGAYAPPALHAMAARTRVARPVVQPRRVQHPRAAGADVSRGRPAGGELPGDAARRELRPCRSRAPAWAARWRSGSPPIGMRCRTSTCWLAASSAIPERAVRRPVDDQAVALAHRLGIPVGDLGQPATGRLHLRRVTDAREDASAP